MKKKVIIIVSVVVAVGLLATGITVGVKKMSNGNSADRVYVEQISDIAGRNTGVVSSFSGLVESQETWDITKEADREVKEVFVSVGDTVKEGDKLFEYDTDDIQSKIDQLNLDIEGLTNEIANANSQITELTEEKQSAPADQQFEYTSQIQTLQTSIKQDQIDQKGKESEIEKYKKSMENSVVTSKMDGIVKSINSNSSSADSSSSYMSILATGDYRIKGSVDEQNIYTISEGMQVIIRSRVDETVTWTGSITKIDTESNQSSSNSESYYSADSGEQATKYPFYVTLDSTDGLMLGQHVFIEPDYGQADIVEKEGIWIDDSYVVTEGDETYVWASNSRNKLEKREVTLGDHDDDMMQYEIISGLTEDDYICYPMQGLYEGVRTVTSYDEVDYDAPLYNQEDGSGDNGDYVEDSGDAGDYVEDSGDVGDYVEDSGDVGDYVEDSGDAGDVVDDSADTDDSGDASEDSGDSVEEE